jgi:peptide subunit release factor 1 (eRF1)
MARGKKQEYLCIECGTKMEKADEEVFVCPNCNHSVEIVDYGHENDYVKYFWAKTKPVMTTIIMTLTRTMKKRQ